MLVTMGARRSAHYGDVDGTTGYQTNIAIDDENTVTETNNSRDAKRLVQDVTRLLRMSHTLYWAAVPTCSDGFGDVHYTEGGILGDKDAFDGDFDASQFGPMLLSMQGLAMLVRYNQLTENEMKALIATGLPPSQYPYVLMEWAAIRCMDGMESKELRSGPGFEENLLKYFAQLRAEYFTIGDITAGRMPMAYVQFMEVLVDLLIVLAPLALYTKMGTFNIISTGLLCTFFKGLLELSKSFLDPFGREGYRAHNIRVDVLVSEMNFGASSRWINAGDTLPSELLEQRADVTQSTSADHQQSSPPPSMMTNTSFAEWMAQDHDSLNKDDGMNSSGMPTVERQESISNPKDSMMGAQSAKDQMDRILIDNMNDVRDHLNGLDVEDKETEQAEVGE